MTDAEQQTERQAQELQLRLMSLGGRNRLPSLTLWERLRAWLASKERLAADVKQHRRRIHALMMAKDEALTQALVWENGDITRWLETIAITDKGKLGARLMEVEARDAASSKRLIKLAASERRAWDTLQAVTDAWAVAAGVMHVTEPSVWKDGREVVVHPILPQTVLDALTEWVNRDRKPKPEPEKAPG